MPANRRPSAAARPPVLRRLALLFAALICAPALAHAEIQVDVTRGNLDPLPIATPDFIGQGGQESAVGKDIARVVRADLERSGLFRTIDPASYIEKVSDINVQPRFADWKLVNAKALAVGRATATADGKLRGEYRLWDVSGEAPIHDREYITTPENWRRIAHKIADDIYERLTGEKGYFDTRIVFISESGPKTKRIKKLAIMDQDGANPSFLTSGDFMVLTPRFSPTAQMITYMSFETGRPRVFLFDIDKNRQEVLGDFSAMTFSPRFMPDGASVLLTREGGGNSEIYRMDLRTRTMARLTTNPAIDTSPSASPDGAEIVFNSDRGGSPQLYIMKADGADPKRISFGDGRYMTPVWSPRGDLIAFTKQAGGRFQIGVMKPDGSGERILSESYLDEGPSWSPNGRVIMFFREGAPGAGPSLWSVDLTGQNLRRIQTPGDASDPAWSPLLP
jgi:TolB protein